jgi:hypothetical protein
MGHLGIWETRKHIAPNNNGIKIEQENANEKNQHHPGCSQRADQRHL